MNILFSLKRGCENSKLDAFLLLQSIHFCSETFPQNLWQPDLGSASGQQWCKQRCEFEWIHREERPLVSLEILSCSELLACQVWPKHLSSCLLPAVLVILTSVPGSKCFTTAIEHFQNLKSLQWFSEESSCDDDLPKPCMQCTVLGRNRCHASYDLWCCLLPKTFELRMGLSKTEWGCKTRWHLAYFVNCLCTVGVLMAS